MGLAQNYEVISAVCKGFTIWLLNNLELLINGFIEQEWSSKYLIGEKYINFPSKTFVC